jgi:hypothetical protein
MAMMGTLQRGGNMRQAMIDYDQSLKADGHTLNPTKMTEIEKIAKEMHTQMVNGQIYGAWKQAKAQGVDEKTFAKALYESRESVGKSEITPEERTEDDKYADFGEHFEIDKATRTSFNELEDSAKKASQTISDIIRDLDANKNADKKEDELKKFLADMAKSIMDYQASGSVNEVVLVKMVDTYNVTAERTDQLKINFDASKVTKLPPVKHFEKNPSSGTYELKEKSNP